MKYVLSIVVLFMNLTLYGQLNSFNEVPNEISCK